MAEFDEVATGERTPGLLQAAARRETADIDRREAETLDELFDECGRFGWSPETKITRRPPFLPGPSLKRAVRIELNAFTIRAPGARAATTSLAPLPPRSARMSFGLVSTKGFVASMSTRPFQVGRLSNADSTFRQGTASNT